jgi:hypothetical protein
MLNERRVGCWHLPNFSQGSLEYFANGLAKLPSRRE